MKRKCTYIIKMAFAALVATMVAMMPLSGIAQKLDPKIDTLIKQSLNTPDSLSARINNEICWKLRNLNPEVAIQYCMKALEIAKKTGDKEQEVKSYAYLGVCQRNLDNFDEALKYYKLGIQKAKEFNVEDQLGYGYINLGNLLIYQKKFNDAEDKLKEALPIANKLGDSAILAYAYLNLGRAKLGMKDFDKSEEYLIQAIRIRTECKKLNKQMSVPMKYLADCHAAAGLIQLALNEYINTLRVVDNIGDYDLLGELTYRIADIYYTNNQKRNYDSAIYYANESLAYARNIGSKKAISEAYKIMSDVYKSRNDYKSVSDCYIRQMACYDSLFKKQVEQQQYNINYSADTYTRQLTIESLNNEKRLAKQITIMAAIILSLVMLGLIFVIFNIRKINRLNKLVETRNNKLEAANYEITSSINYARRIQQSALSTIESISDVFPDSMVYYKPKEIVSGDWYRVEKIKGRVIVAEGDCTESGVPGSLLTMMSMSIFKDTVNNTAKSEQPMKASAMLDKMRQQVKIMFNSNNGDDPELDSGMDASLAVIDPQTRQMSFAAACQTAILIRDGEVTQLKGDSIRVGKFIREDEFTEQQVQLQHGDTLYILNNGIRDLQNPDGERFVSRRLTDFLVENNDKPMTQIRDLLKDEIDHWSQSSSNNDITAIGLRIE